MPQSRFDRDYSLVVGVSETRSVVVRPPLRIVFSADKSVLGGSLSKITIKIYNLSEQNRLALAKDSEDYTKLIPVTLSVGYSGSLGSIFKGTVQRGETTRSGPDFITELTCYDGYRDYVSSFTARTVRGARQAVEAILSDMPNTGRGKLTQQDELLRPRVLVGRSAKLLEGLINAGETWYIEDEKLYIIKDEEVTSNFIPVVNAASGLLNTPSREQSRLVFDTLMNPMLKIGGRCQVESVNAPHLNGVYKIYAIGYNGDNYGANWRQSVTCTLSPNYTVL